MARDLTTILLSTEAEIKSRIEEAFEAGRAAGYGEADIFWRQKIATAIGMDTPKPQAQELKPAHFQNEAVFHSPTVGARAPSGTVKPAIIANLKSHLAGMTMKEIGDLTGAKRNSVRGTLYTLKQEGQVENRDNRWFWVAPKKIEAADNDSVEGSSAASNQQPGAQGGEARPGGGT